jgi:transcriptional adapter 2-alpha
MCLECLRLGRTSNELPEHQADHSYFVYDNLNFPLFTKDWTAKEELLLLQGIMKCGLGNWADIATQFVETKDMKECEEHYFCFYYKSKQESLPNDDDFIVKN